MPAMSLPLRAQTFAVPSWPAAVQRGGVAQRLRPQAWSANRFVASRAYPFLALRPALALTSGRGNVALSDAAEPSERRSETAAVGRLPVATQRFARGAANREGHLAPDRAMPSYSRVQHRHHTLIRYHLGGRGAIHLARPPRRFRFFWAPQRIGNVASQWHALHLSPGTTQRILFGHMPLLSSRHHPGAPSRIPGAPGGLPIRPDRHLLRHVSEIDWPYDAAFGGTSKVAQQRHRRRQLLDNADDA